MADTPGEAHDAPKSSIRETVSSVAIAFAMAFIFRAFVIEAFVIPTGSMAPTLLGRHMEFVSEQTGTRFQVGPWADGPRAEQTLVTVHDPMTTSFPAGVVRGSTAARRPAHEIERPQGPLRAGDRILVLKYLPPLFSPSRYDVVVFKNPTDPTQNYIKRLTGLPGEQLAIVDGDVFARPASAPPSTADLERPGGSWALDGWRIRRKPEQAQRAVWMPVHDTSHAPVDPVRNGFTWYSPPWLARDPEGGPGGGWSGLDGRTPTYTGDGPTRLVWDAQRWPLVDHYPYNERYRRTGQTLRPLTPATFGVGDVRVRMGVQPTDAALGSLTIEVQARGHRFRARIAGGKATLAMRPQAPADGDWTQLAQADGVDLPAGEITDVEFWHADQALWLLVEGERVAYAPYDWGPIERFENATGLPLRAGEPTLPEPSVYAPGRPSIELGGPARLHRLAVDRDLYYQSTRGDSAVPVRGSHPTMDLAVLGEGQYFVCGDNSASSQDSRLLDGVSPWVGGQLDVGPGIIPVELMMGKAFFVYFPAMERRMGLPVPGFGRLRFIW